MKWPLFIETRIENGHFICNDLIGKEKEHIIGYIR